MDGLDNKNISRKDMFDFLENVINGDVICPLCKKHNLKVTRFIGFENLPYIVLEPTKGFVVECDCGFKNEFNTAWCLYGVDGRKRKYHIGRSVGGTMENPDIHYEEIYVIEARSKEEAIRLYEEKYGKSYWSTVIVE